ncbi:UNVERIFIED_CONTAM: hypothetical protein RMT77_005586 [Armadillidium vulgare]
MSVSVQFCCFVTSVLSSVILVIVGFSQLYISSADVERIDYIHLLFQILAGSWSMATGALCIFSLYKNSSEDSKEVLGKKIFLLINFAVEILATSLLFVDMSGTNVSLKQYIPAFKWSDSSTWKIHAKDVMYFATSGTISIFMGMVIWITSLCNLREREYLHGDLDVKFLSARCKFGNETEDFLLNETFIWPKYLTRGQSLHIIKDNRKTERELKDPDHKSKSSLVIDTPKEMEVKTPENKNTDKVPSVHKEKTPVQNQAAKEANKTTYIRFYDDDDCDESPAKDTLYVSDVNEKKMTPLASIKRYSISPRRSPLKVATPTPPKSFRGKRTLSSPFCSKILGTINENESLKLISPKSLSTYNTPSSRLFGTWSSGCRSSGSSSSDYLSVFSSCSSPNVTCP